MELYIIRHAQSANNVSMMYDPKDRQADPPLTELGFRQAEAVARYLVEGADIDTWVGQRNDEKRMGRGFGISELYCSPMLRTLQTCQPISAALGVKTAVWVELYEHGGLHKDYGDERGVVGMPGLSRSEMARMFPTYELPEGVTEAGWYEPGLGEEDRVGCQARAIRVANMLWERAGEDARIGLVTHGNFADELMKALLNLLPGYGLSVPHYNTGITRFDLRPERHIRLRYFNRVSHLEAEMVSG